MQRVLEQLAEPGAYWAAVLRDGGVHQRGGRRRRNAGPGRAGRGGAGDEVGAGVCEFYDGVELRPEDSMGERLACGSAATARSRSLQVPPR